MKNNKNERIYELLQSDDDNNTNNIKNKSNSNDDSEMYSNELLQLLYDSFQCEIQIHLSEILMKSLHLNTLKYYHNFKGYFDFHEEINHDFIMKTKIKFYGIYYNNFFSNNSLILYDEKKILNKFKIIKKMEQLGIYISN